MEKILISPRPQSDVNVLCFEVAQRTALELFYLVEEGLSTALDSQIEKEIEAAKKYSTSKKEFRKKEKLIRGNQERYKARVKAYKTKINDFQKIFESASIYHNSIINEAVDGSLDFYNEIFEQSL